MELHRALDLRLEVVQVGDGRGRDVRDLVRHRDQRRVLALAEDVAGLVADRLRVRGARRRAASRSSAARPCSCRPRCRSRRRARRRSARTSRRGRRSRCRACRRRRPGATHADVVAALRLQRGRDAGRDRRRVAEQRVEPGQLPGRLRVRRREDLEAAGRVRGDQPALGRAHRGVEHVAGAERLAAALAGAVARGERVRALRCAPARCAASGSSRRLPTAKLPTW